MLHPGKVVSQHDGDVHYITYAELARLYRVDLEHCAVVQPTTILAGKNDLIHLYPREAGDYDEIAAKLPRP